MMKILLFVFILVIGCTLNISANTFYVSTTGNDLTGDGSNLSPWATISFAMNQIADGDTIFVKPGTYNEGIDLGGNFPNGIVVKSEVDYMAKLRNNDRVLKFYQSVGVTVEGFDIAHDGPGASALVIHIDGNGDGSTHDITLFNNIIHDSYNNDLAKINNACYNILVKNNLFFNQQGSDEHIDGNSVLNLTIEDNIFMSDFASSGRAGEIGTVNSHIVIKDSNGNSDIYLGSENVTIRRNIFMSYEGNPGTAMIQFGEDGTANFEAFNCLVENNLLLGNSSNQIRAPFQIKGVSDIDFRNNTVHGDFPSNAYIMRAVAEGSNQPCQNISLYNNIWSDTTGTMIDVFDVESTGDLDLSSFILDNNMYWNDGNSIPSTGTDVINFSDDSAPITDNPLLGSLNGMVPPYWNGNTFNDNSNTIREAFEKLVFQYATPSTGSLCIDAASPTNAPADDILGHLRIIPDIGAIEVGASLGIKKHVISDLEIYPNPTDGIVSIRKVNAEHGVIVILSADGRIVLKPNCYDQNKINLTELPAGLYFILVEMPYGSQMVRVLKI